MRLLPERCGDRRWGSSSQRVHNARICWTWGRRAPSAECRASWRTAPTTTSPTTTDADLETDGGPASQWRALIVLERSCSTTSWSSLVHAASGGIIPSGTVAAGATSRKGAFAGWLAGAHLDRGGEPQGQPQQCLGVGSRRRGRRRSRFEFK